MLLFPPALRPGDLVAIVAPSGPLPREPFWHGLAWIRDRYRVLMRSSVLSRAGYLAGDDARRAAELSEALGHPDVRAVIAGRGGYGAMRVLERGAMDGLSKHPRWIVGFSDVTALHAVASSLGIASIHGPNVTGLGRAPPHVRSAWLAALERPRDATEWSRLVTVHPGYSRLAEGVASGGNLALVHAMASAGKVSSHEGAVVFLEDTDERPYRIDRMLTSLRMNGALERARALVFGGFTRSDPGPDGVTALDVIRDRTRDLGIPVVARAPFGHIDDNLAFVLGRRVKVEAKGDVASVAFLPG